MKNPSTHSLTDCVQFQSVNLSPLTTFSTPTVSGSLQLHHLVNNLLTDLLPQAVRKRTLILNEIPGGFELRADENMVAYVLWNLMSNVVNTSANECIHVEAIKAGNCTMISLRHVSNYFYRSFSGDLRQVQDIAVKLGGCISIECNGENETTVTFVIGDKIGSANAA